MKKIYLFLSAATLMSVANAGGRSESIHFEKAMPNMEATLMKSSPMKAIKAIGKFDKTKTLATRAEDSTAPFVYYRPASDVMAIGMSPNGYGIWGVTLGFVSSYGNVVFNNYSTGYSSLQWKYANVDDYEVVNNEAVWNISTSDAKDLEVKSGIGTMMNPELTINDASGEQLTYVKSNVDTYFCGGSAADWFAEDPYGAIKGSSFYQNYCMLDSEGMSGAIFYNNAYFHGNGLVNEDGVPMFNDNGVYVDPDDWINWPDYFDEAAGTEVKNLAIESFVFFQNKPASAYMMSTMWGPLNISATADTQLISYIYPYGENGISDTPIALGYASIAKGNTSIPIFEYVAINEDGDEVEEPIVIDSEVVITVEGFVGNDAIESIAPSSGYYPFSWNQYEQGNYGVITEPTLYMRFTFDMNGDKYQSIECLSAIGGYDIEDKDSATLFAYHQLCTDAVFPFIHAVNGEESVNVSNAGGEVSVDLISYWIGLPELVEEGYFEVSAPEWIKVSFGEESQATGATPMTVTVDATETGRTGVVTVAGPAEKYELKVIQGDGAVNSIAIDKNAQYFDLAGRRVANPEKGVYIKKTGNKAEKVLF